MATHFLKKTSENEYIMLCIKMGLLALKTPLNMPYSDRLFGLLQWMWYDVIYM